MHIYEQRSLTKQLSMEHCGYSEQNSLVLKILKNIIQSIGFCQFENIENSLCDYYSRFTFSHSKYFAL